MTAAALRRGLEETLQLVDDAIAVIDHQLEENEKQRLKLVEDRDTWCRRRETLRREAASSNGDHG